MRKEIQSLMSGKALSFMASISEKLDIKAAAEYEIEKIKVAKTLIRESSELDEAADKPFHFQVKDKKSGKTSKITISDVNQGAALKRARADARYTVIGVLKEDGSLDEKLHGDQHQMDHNEDGDIDAEDMKNVKKKGPNLDHPLAENSINGNDLKNGQVKIQGNYISARNSKGDRKNWEWHTEYESAKINKSDWLKNKKIAAQEFARS